MARRFDQLDLRILDELQEDGRRPFAKVARNLGVSEGTVRARVSRLQRLRLVKFVAEVDPLQMGLSLTHVGISVRGTSVRQVADSIARIPEINFIVVSLGSFDLFLEVVCADNEDLFRIIELIKSISGVDRVETFTALEVTKDIYSYSAWEPLVGGAGGADGP